MYILYPELIGIIFPLNAVNVTFLYGWQFVLEYGNGIDL